MKCPFSIGETVRVNDSAEVALEHIGETAVIINCTSMEAGNKDSSDPIEHDKICLATIQFDNEDILADVPSSELSSL